MSRTRRGVFSSTRHTVAVSRTQAGDPELVRLLEEQAALRRVATLVARGTDSLGLFAAVAEEVGQLFGADVTSMIRFDDGHGTIVGVWSRGPTPSAPIGVRVSMEQDSTAARVHGTGRPARVDVDDLPGEVYAVLRELGVRASVGAPIVVHGELWGAVVGATKDASFPPGAEQRLAAFAALVAQALANAEAREELAASRRRLVEAAQVERRRLERNLHDGAQQRLVGLAMTLRLAQRHLERDPATAREALARANTELSEALKELRELARGLHPAVLTDHGLQAALGALAARAPLPVDLGVDLDDRPAEPLEAAAYFVVAEALTNVARYASARTASVTVRREADELLVEVTDDGSGGANPDTGTGLRGLIDRVDALGGRLEVHSPVARGTTVRAWLPET
jgi:signal transduction histidine kinase